MNYTKTVWKDLPDTSTPITADKLNNIEDGVEYLFENGTGGGGDNLPVGTELDFDGTSQDIPTGWEEITNPDSYSTSEVKTNKVWIDNKPIYRKVASFNVSSDSQQVLQINVENVDVIIEGKFILKGSDFCAIDHTHIDSTNNHISKWVFTIHNTDVSTTISKTIGNSGIYYVILEYTKTTD